MKNIYSSPFDSHFRREHIYTRTHTHGNTLTSSKEEMLISSNVAVVSSALHIVLYLTACGEVLRRDKLKENWELEREHVSGRERFQSEGSGDC